MKTVSILQYDHEDKQFYPSFVIRNDFQDVDNECSFEELILQPSEAWMTDYLEWNRFGRLPDDPAEDPCEEYSIPIFDSLEELHQFNARGQDLTQRLQAELKRDRNPDQPASCTIQVAPYQPLYTNVVVGPVSAWWHVKDLNYGFVVPVQRLPVSDHLKSRLQAFRCHKGMEFWKFNDSETMQQLQQEGRELHNDLLQELHADGVKKAPEDAACSNDSSTGAVQRAESCASIGAMLEQSCTLVGAATSTPTIERASRLPRVSPRAQ